MQKALDKLGFNLVGYGCTTCIGNSGPLPDPIAEAVTRGDLVAVSVLSGNRNFEGRVHPHVRANYLASPMLVVAYALAGNMGVDLVAGSARRGPERQAGLSARHLADQPRDRGRDPQGGQRHHVPQALRRRLQGRRALAPHAGREGLTYEWEPEFDLCAQPALFRRMTPQPAPLADIVGARPLALLGDSITTDHISPAGSIKKDSPAGRYLIEHGVRSPTSTPTARGAAITR